ncbi:MAG: hypothetical protein ABI587_08980 [Gemmatimonadales bacterium]
MRPTPFDVAFGAQADERFPRIRDSLAASARDPHDLDAFTLDREVVTLLRELVPDEGVGEAIAEHIALLHHSYLYWAEGGWLVQVSRARARRLLGAEARVSESAPPPTDTPRAAYVQFPEHLVWAALGEGEPHQPLDGLFVRAWPAGGFFVLAIFSMHPSHEGFTVVEADGHAANVLAREDGTALFSPVLPGGAAAGLYSIVGGEELLELAARTRPLLEEAQACIGPAHRAHQPVEVS